MASQLTASRYPLTWRPALPTRYSPSMIPLVLAQTPGISMMPETGALTLAGQPGAYKRRYSARLTIDSAADPEHLSLPA